ncbi:MAG: hypothetical protein AMXMBFR84_25990 [Candidatus Hydrogenedentota bacterium]
MKRIGVAFVVVLVAVGIAIGAGCASVQRTLQLKTELALMPATQEAANQELALLDARITTCDAWISTGPTVQELLKLDPKVYDKAMAEAKSNLQFMKERRDTINSMLPTLPSRPAPGA